MSNTHPESDRLVDLALDLSTIYLNGLDLDLVDNWLDQAHNQLRLMRVAMREHACEFNAEDVWLMMETYAGLRTLVASLEPVAAEFTGV